MGFWEESRASMRRKIDRFCEVCKELDLPYSEPEGGYFLVVNLVKLKLPDDYVYPLRVQGRPRDFKMAYFLLMEIGLAAIPPASFTLRRTKRQ
jgi:kynurenine aminotransferase